MTDVALSTRTCVHKNLKNRALRHFLRDRRKVLVQRLQWEPWGRWSTFRGSGHVKCDTCFKKRNGGLCGSSAATKASCPGTVREPALSQWTWTSRKQFRVSQPTGNPRGDRASSSYDPRLFFFDPSCAFLLQFPFYFKCDVLFFFDPYLFFLILWFYFFWSLFVFFWSVSRLPRWGCQTKPSS